MDTSARQVGAASRKAPAHSPDHSLVRGRIGAEVRPVQLAAAVDRCSRAAHGTVASEGAVMIGGEGCTCASARAGSSNANRQPIGNRMRTDQHIDENFRGGKRWRSLLFLPPGSSRLQEVVSCASEKSYVGGWHY